MTTEEAVKFIEDLAGQPLEKLEVGEAEPLTLYQKTLLRMAGFSGGGDVWGVDPDRQRKRIRPK